ncbi:MAG: hypothetical protein ACC658_17215 [Acidimicrobiia bacterium]
MPSTSLRAGTIQSLRSWSSRTICSTAATARIVQGDGGGFLYEGWDAGHEIDVELFEEQCLFSGGQDRVSEAPAGHGEALRMPAAITAHSSIPG